MGTYDSALKLGKSLALEATQRLSKNNERFAGRIGSPELSHAKPRDVFSKEKLPLSQFAKEHEEFLIEEYKRLYKNLRRENINQADLDALLRCTQNDIDMTIIDNLLRNYSAGEVAELMKFPQKRVLQTANSFGVFDKEKRIPRAFSFDELKNILAKYPDIDGDYLSFLTRLEIQTDEILDKRMFYYDELLPLLKSTKLQDKFLQMKKLEKEIDRFGVEGVQNGNKTGKIPRYIYHLTSKENYEKMLQNGVLQTTSDGWFKQKGIFAVELENLFKRWGNNELWEECPLQLSLLEHAAKDSDKIVILKIPTAKLEQENLYIRSQNQLIPDHFGLSDYFEQICESPRYKNKQQLDTQDFFDIINHALNKRIANLNSQKHLAYGAPAGQSKLYKQRREAIEYIYGDSIPMSDIKKIGEANVAGLKKHEDEDDIPVEILKNIFQELFKGTPEEKSLILFD